MPCEYDNLKRMWLFLKYVSEILVHSCWRNWVIHSQESLHCVGEWILGDKSRLLENGSRGDLFSSAYELSSVQDFLIIYGYGNIFSWDLKGILYGIKAKKSFSIWTNSLETSSLHCRVDSTQGANGNVLINACAYATASALFGKRLASQC